MKDGVCITRDQCTRANDLRQQALEQLGETLSHTTSQKEITVKLKKIVKILKISVGWI